MRRFLIALVIVGYVAAELAILNWLAGSIGWLWVMCLLATQFAVGVAIARRAGASAFRRLGQAMQRGSLPDGTVGNSALVSLGGVLLAIPGLISDAFAILLFIPPTRRVIRRITGVTVGLRIQAAGFSTTQSTAADGTTVTRMHEGVVIEGEVVGEVIDEPLSRGDDPKIPKPHPKPEN